MRKLRGFVVVLALVAGMTLGIQGTAAAATVNLRIVVTTANCPLGGSVNRIWLAIVPGGIPDTANAKAGDTATLATPVNNGLVTITGKAYCQRSWGRSYYGPDIVALRWVASGPSQTTYV